jgi:hypothetical protein
MKLLRRSALMLLIASAAYLGLLAYPDPLFAHEVSYAGITVHSTQAIPDAMQATLDRARARLDRSAVAAATRDVHVYICQPRWLFAVFARQNYRVGGVADWLVGQHVFLRESDLQNDRLIGPSGQPVAADRPLSYFIAHEIMHIAHARTVGRRRYGRMPQWLDDGHADYVARDIDFGGALQKMKEGAPGLDPARSGLYVRYALMVAYLLDKQRVPLAQLFASPPRREDVEQALVALSGW